ncbi:MAG: S41 family peptidase [Ktedonobacteraceae bacterium]
MSSYDDPRWYEQAESHDGYGPPPEPTPEPTYPLPTQQQPPTPASQSSPSSIWPRVPTEIAPERPSRRRKLLGQIVVVASLVIIAFLAGWFGHQLYTTTFALNSQSQYYEGLFNQAWTVVDQNYVDRKAVNYKQMSYQAISAMLNVLGDTGHTRFLNPQQVQSENQQLSGSFTGIGIYLQQDPKTKDILIAAPIPGSPAAKAGLKHDDIITAVNGHSTKGKDINGLSAMIVGPAGQTVSITIYRPSTKQTLTFKIVRAVIQVPNVLMHYIPQDHIADIEIVQFSDGVSTQLKTDLLQAKKLGATKIILDLRENPGGYLSEAVNTVSEFIKSGNVLLEQDSTGSRTPVPVTGATVDTTIPIVVLVNKDTASAAEIVSGALQDNHRAIIMGVTTFGTGTVLEQFTLSDGSAILLGTQEWLTPNGQFIRGQGITPNIQVKDPNNVILTPDLENASNMTEQQIMKSGDTQLIAAIRYLESH